MVVHVYVHKPLELQAGLYATQPAMLPDDHHPDRAPPEPPGRLITAVSSTAVSSTEANPHFVGRFTPTKFALNRSMFQNG